jgi:hypothetical protein
VEKILAKMAESPNNIRYDDLKKVCIDFLVILDKKVRATRSSRPPGWVTLESTFKGQRMAKRSPIRFVKY